MTAEEKPNRDRITQVRFSGLRTAADVVLDCEAMTVLIGPNGVGKSTLIEGLELLRKLPLGTEFLRAVHDDHGGAGWLLRRGMSDIKFGADISDGTSVASYDVVLARRNGGFITAQESLRLDSEVVYLRDGDEIARGAAGTVLPSGSIDVKWPILGMLTAVSPTAMRVVNALAGIEVHVPFATQARWLGPGAVPERTMRGDTIVQSTGRLARGGANLANAIHELRNRPDWVDTLETIRLVVDDDIADVTTPASASGGSIGLAVSYRTTGSIPAFALSDGTLALPGLIAIARLDGGSETPRSLLVLDEPDLHLHPGAVGQVVALLEECSAKHPVVIATHSDRLLDSLSEPASATVLCDLDETRSLRLRRPDKPQLERWLAEYRGIGRLRAEGYDKLVFPTPKTAKNA